MAISFNEFKILHGNLHGFRSKYKFEQREDGVVTVSGMKLPRPLDVTKNKTRTKSLQVTLLPKPLPQIFDTNRHILFNHKSPEIQRWKNMKNEVDYI